MKEIKTAEDVKNASAKELVTFYNAHNVTKPVTRFSDRKAAEKRCLALLASLEALEESSPVESDVVAYTPRAVKEKVEVNTDDMSDAEFEAYVKSGLDAIDNAHEEMKDIQAAKVRASNSAGIARSWNDPAVAAARLTRDAVRVKVNGKEAGFKSVRQAFAALNLPDSKHIRFRMKLKAAKKATFEWAGTSYLFEID